MQLLYKINLYVISSHAKNVCPTFVYSWSFAFKLQGYVGMYYTGEIRAFKNKLVYLTTYLQFCSIRIRCEWEKN